MTKKYNVVFTKSFLIEVDEDEQEADALEEAYQMFEKQMAESYLRVNDFGVQVEDYDQ